MGANRLSPFLRGVVFGLYLAGNTLSEIETEVERPIQTISDTIRAAKAAGGLAWDGSSAPSTGRPRETSTKLDKSDSRTLSLSRDVCTYVHNGRSRLDIMIQKEIKVFKIRIPFKIPFKVEMHYLASSFFFPSASHTPQH